MVENGRTRTGDDVTMQIKGYSSATSVNVGEHIDFHVTVNPEQDFMVAIYRLGHYAGDGARLMTSRTIRGVTQPRPDLDPATGMISCDWPPSWTLDVPLDWTSGVYLAVLTTETGWRSHVPFVVRDDNRRADFMVVLPFSTYQAYNMWPVDGRLGKNLYYGFEPVHDTQASDKPPPGRKIPALRARKVSFDRPYGSNGIPSQAQYDFEFVRWAERAGYSMVYATSNDLHAGVVDPSRYAGLVFSGHDEYWSHAMRDALVLAIEKGVNIAFLSANNAYWHIRFEASADGREDRGVVCYKTDLDPDPGASGATTKWRTRQPGPGKAEQALLGVQYRAVVPQPQPLVVRSAGHWLWTGCGLRDGDAIPNIVGGEADCFDVRYKGPDGNQTLLSASPFVMTDGTEVVQNTSIYESAQGGIVFVAGTFHWTFGLGRDGYADPRIQTAMANLMARMLLRP
jgi:hypothetical protein